MIFIDLKECYYSFPFMISARDIDFPFLRIQPSPKPRSFTR